MQYLLLRFSFFCSLTPYFAACSAISRTARWCYISIFFIVMMPLRAMSFCTLHCTSNLASVSAYNILLVRNWLKMRWLNAGRVSAKMIYIHIWWYNATVKLIRKSMGSDKFFAVPKYAITKRVLSANPIPARVGFLDFRPKSFFSGFRWAGKATCFWVMFHNVRYCITQYQQHQEVS